MKYLNVLSLPMLLSLCCGCASGHERSGAIRTEHDSSAPKAAALPATAGLPHIDPSEAVSHNCRSVPPPLFFSCLSTSSGYPAHSFVGAIRERYEGSGYADEEIAGFSQSLRSLALSDRALPHESQTNCDEDQDLRFYFDPLCDSCRAVSEVILELRDKWPHFFEFNLSLHPVADAANEASVEAVKHLLTIASSSMETFNEAALAAVFVLPSRPSSVADFFASNFIAATAQGGEGVAGALARSGDDQATAVPSPLYTSDAERQMIQRFGTPLVLFRGTILRRRTEDEFPFHPLRSSAFLSAALLTIYTVDCESPCSGPTSP